MLLVTAASAPAETLPGPGAGGPLAPSCAAVPRAVEDPATAPTPSGYWRIPPDGTCALVERENGLRAMELRYADGRLWAEWFIGPLDQGRGFHLPDGTTVRVGPPLLPGIAPAVRVAAPGGAHAMAPALAARPTARRCIAGTPVLRARPGHPVVIRFAGARLVRRAVVSRTGTRHVWPIVVGPRGAGVWQVPATLRGTLPVDLTVTRADRQIVHHRFCVRL